MRLISLLSPLMLMAATATFADESTVLQYDSRPPLQGTPHFRQDQRKNIPRHDFVVSDYALMSNDQGERWAVVTLKNTAGGQRLLANDYLLAEFADGGERYALNLEGKVEASEIITKTVFLGYHRFPIMRLRWQ